MYLLIRDFVILSHEQAIETDWAVVDPILDMEQHVHCYEPGSWGPAQADALIEGNGHWHNPLIVREKEHE